MDVVVVPDAVAVDGGIAPPQEVLLPVGAGLLCSGGRITILDIIERFICTTLGTGVGKYHSPIGQQNLPFQKDQDKLETQTGNVPIFFYLHHVEQLQSLAHEPWVSPACLRPAPDPPRRAVPLALVVVGDAGAKSGAEPTAVEAFAFAALLQAAAFPVATVHGILRKKCRFIRLLENEFFSLLVSSVRRLRSLPGNLARRRRGCRSGKMLVKQLKQLSRNSFPYLPAAKGK